ncbi:MAG TPA: AAA-like domain-containing protein, partial [Fimbriimonadaceae bacterium]|nr:AAA-like domain-containing protein [Fimbriimonadaceae bacterium]
MADAAEPRSSFFVAGGTLAADATSYVKREADDRLFDALTAGEFCYVLNSRQMGKSSICVRTMGRLEAAGTRTAFVDLTKIGGRNVTSEQWYAGIAVEIGRSLELRNEILAFWKENAGLSGVQRLFGALRDVVLERISGHVAVFFDEIDATRSLGFSADEFFAAIRESYNRRVRDPELRRLTFCLLGVAVPSDLINSPTSTPFNIGERITLRDFTLEEMRPLAEGLSNQPQA